MPFSISTKAGPLQFDDVPSELFNLIADRWPMGIQEAPMEGERQFAICFRRGQEEMFGVKLQPPDCDSEEDALVWTHVYGWHVALAAGQYLQREYGGLLLTGVYRRAKEAHRFEPGIALFPVPAPEGGETRVQASFPHIDRKLGCGSGEMVSGMLQAMAQTRKQEEPPFRLIGIDVRPPSKLESLWLDLLFYGPHLICLRTHPSADDPVWEHLVRGGVRTLFHMPSFPAAVP